MIDHDRLFKDLITTFFVEFLELFFPEMLRYLDTSQLEFLDKELVTDVTGGSEMFPVFHGKELRQNPDTQRTRV